MQKATTTLQIIHGSMRISTMPVVAEIQNKHFLL